MQPTRRTTLPHFCLLMQRRASSQGSRSSQSSGPARAAICVEFETPDGFLSQCLAAPSLKPQRRASDERVAWCASRRMVVTWCLNESGQNRAHLNRLLQHDGRQSISYCLVHRQDIRSVRSVRIIERPMQHLACPYRNIEAPLFAQGFLCLARQGACRPQIEELQM